MNSEDWTRKVFRLRKLPKHVSRPTEAAELVAEALEVSLNHVIIYSLAATLDTWENPPSKVATLQLKRVPKCLREKMINEEWPIPLPGEAPGQRLLLDAHFEGLTPLNDVEAKNHIVDCIAISGLASHAFGSWQPRGNDKSFMWIRDEVPRSVPGVRAITYGYNSKLKGSNSFQSISHIALNLILHLKAGGWNSMSSKPIVFLAHSLGGLVLKDAITQIADARDSRIVSILGKAQGALMFGVPSLGMEQHHLRAMVEGEANEILVQDLSRENGANYLRQLNKRFDGISFTRRIRFFWAYETKVSETVCQRPDGAWDRHGPRAVLVNPDSATCNHNRNDKSSTIPINEDHSDMVKFSEGDANLGLIISALTDLCSPSPSISGSSFSSLPQGFEADLAPPSLANSLGSDIDWLSKDETTSNNADAVMHEFGQILSDIEELHKTLYSPELDFRVDQIAEPFQDTFKWIFDLDIFCSWLQKESGLFWIHGKPGSGKSTLMKFIFRSVRTWELLHDWKRDSYEITAGFFLHYRGTAIQKSFEGVLRSLLTQILTPHRVALRKQYQPILDQLQRHKKTQQRLEREISGIKENLSSIKLVVLQRLAQEMETLEQEKRALEQEISNLAQSGSVVRAPLPAQSVPDNVDLTVLQNNGKKLKELEKRQQGLRQELGEVKKRQYHLQIELKALELEFNSTRKAKALLVQAIASCRAAPETLFLHGVVTEFHKTRDGPIAKLEKILRLLLDQNIIKMDLILFFDALDEFDGHLDLICRFLKDLVKKSATSTTRVKVCFSSRPWEPLKNHFSSYPGFSLQVHTKNDIEEYAAGSLASLETAYPPIIKLVPTIIAYANGVFLWVKLALKELSDTASSSNEMSGVSKDLEERLRALPTDLDEFYKLIIERISKTNRRYTYALLELLIRHDDRAGQVTAAQIRDAVLTSVCTTYQEAQGNLDREYRECVASDMEERIRHHISTWGGGLVEIKTMKGKELDSVQLMHQTVLEFATGLEFKRIVVGDLAGILNENGHSFHLKYLLLWRNLATVMKANGHSTAQHPYLPEVEEWSENPRPWIELIPSIVYHAERSELTTGTSQLEFLSSMAPDELYRLTNTGFPKDSLTSVLSFVVSCGLTLCLRDCISKTPGKLETITVRLVDLPWISRLIFKPVRGSFHENDLTVVRLLLENGYNIKRDPHFFTKLLKMIWETATEGYSGHNKIPIKAMEDLAELVLEYGQDPNISTAMFSDFNLKQCKPLHVAPPLLAIQLIKHGAAPNATDSKGRTPLDWALEKPFELAKVENTQNWNPTRRYEKCNILVQAGGWTSNLTEEAWHDVLLKFEVNGYDTRIFREELEARKSVRKQGGSGKDWLGKSISRLLGVGRRGLPGSTE